MSEINDLVSLAFPAMMIVGTVVLPVVILVEKITKKEWR